MRSYEFSLTNRRGQRIVGTRFVGAVMTDEHEGKGTAVLMHGYSATQHNMQIVALRDCLIGLGRQVVTFDATHSFGRSDEVAAVFDAIAAGETYSEYGWEDEQSV